MKLLLCALCAFRLKEISSQYPVFNEKTEEIWDYNAKFDNDIKRKSKTIQIKSMEKNILNDICAQHRKDGLPSIEKCHYSHAGYSRYKGYEFK